MRNIRLRIEYDGTGFCGWQRQRARQSLRALEGQSVRGSKCQSIRGSEGQRKKRFRSVQEEIERAAQKLFGKNIRLIGAGRTDAGVNAESQVANFRIDSKLPLSNIKKGLNSYLPRDIAIISAEDVELDFHSRFCAKGKLYRYRIINIKQRSPLLERYGLRVSYDMDIDKMKKSAKYFIGKKDYKSFQASDRKERNSVRTIKKLYIITKSPLIEIYIQADGFLYNMVRNIVGTLIDVGRGKIKPEAVKDILSKKYRPLAGQTAPSKGLCLVKVFY